MMVVELKISFALSWTWVSYDGLVENCSLHLFSFVSGTLFPGLGQNFKELRRLT